VPDAKTAGRLMSLQVEWAKKQFRALGSAKREARGLAADVVGAIQGASLLAHFLRWKELLNEQLGLLEHWPVSIAEGPPSTSITSAGRIAASERLPRRSRCLIYPATSRRRRREEIR